MLEMSERTSGQQSRNSSLVKKGEHNMTEAQIKEVTDQLRQDVIAHLWRHRWMKKVVFASIVIFAVWIFSLIASIMFLAWWIKVDSGASKSLTLIKKYRNSNVKPRPQTQKPEAKGPWADTKNSWATKFKLVPPTCRPKKSQVVSERKNMK